jgi:hypothetical protein
MSSSYTYSLILDTETSVPLLESEANSWGPLGTKNVKVYHFTFSPVSESDKLNKYIDHVENTCPEYKLLVIGEHSGHIEIYQSENYKGALQVKITEENSFTMEPWSNNVG